MRRAKGEQFAGLTVALITPFRDGAVDYKALANTVDWHVSQGTDCLAPVGTTGESPTLGHDEHEKVIANGFARQFDPNLTLAVGRNATDGSLFPIIYRVNKTIAVAGRALDAIGELPRLGHRGCFAHGLWFLRQRPHGGQKQQHQC